MPRYIDDDNRVGPSRLPTLGAAFISVLLIGLLIMQADHSSETAQQPQASRPASEVTPGPIPSLAWFYKPPVGRLEDVVADYDTFIMTKADEPTILEMRTLGLRAPVRQYVLAMAIIKPKSPSAQPLRNQVAWERGDFERISKAHPDWFLLDQEGRRVREGNTYRMDPTSEGWREFWLARVRESQDDGVFDGVFMDNLELSLCLRESTGQIPAKYTTDALYTDALASFVKYVRTEYFVPERKALHVNMVGQCGQRTAIEKYRPLIDGYMNEGFAVGWQSSPLSRDEWETQLEEVEKASLQEKPVVLVSQGRRDDYERQRYAFASYLMVATNGVSFRYSDADGSYNQSWLYDNYKTKLGNPTGDRFRISDDSWRRNFDSGHVVVDNDDRTAFISIDH